MHFKFTTKKIKIASVIILVLISPIYLIRQYLLDKNLETKIVKVASFLNQNSKPPFVKINNLNIPVEVAADINSQQKGLSGREFLGEGKGMLFIFPKADYYQFWMPNMYFPIDIVWIEQGKIVGIEKNISNEFNPQNPRFYQPPKPVSYVLEVNAGLAEKYNFNIGDKVEFFNINF